MYAQLPLKIGLREEACFSTYVSENPALDLALENLQHSLIHEGAQLCCFIGDAGTGKTHLLQATCRFQIEAQSQSSSLKSGASVYLPLNDSSLPLFPAVLDGTEQVGLVCVDDVDKVIGQADWEKALTNLLMKSKSLGHSVLLSAHQPIHLWPIVTKELVSAMMSVYPIQLERLSSEKGLVLALQKRSEKVGFHLSVEVCNYLIKQFSNNLQELAAVVGLLEEASFIEKRRITLPFAKQILLKGQP